MTNPVSSTSSADATVRRGLWPRRTASRHWEDRLWLGASRVAVLIPLLGLAFVVVVLFVKAWPAVQVNGVGYLSRSTWQIGNLYGGIQHIHGVEIPQGANYGAWPLIAGTLQSSVIALIVALPLSIGTAFALTERMPKWIAQPLGFFVEILAAIPSVVIGLWGGLVLGPFLSAHVYPLVANHVPNVPVLNYFRGYVGQGEGLLTSGLILGFMIVPIIAATTRDLFNQVPSLPKEGAEALGFTEAEVARRITIPWVRSGIIGATILGFGRALGETMAVAMVSGSIQGHLANNIYGTMTTIAATIVTQLDSSFTDATGFALSNLAEIGLILALISILVNFGARTIVSRSSKFRAPLGRA